LHTVKQWHEGLHSCCWAKGNGLWYWSRYRRSVLASVNLQGELQVVERELGEAVGRGS